MTYNEVDPDDARELSHYCKAGMESNRLRPTLLTDCLGLSGDYRLSGSDYRGRTKLTISNYKLLD